MNNIKTNAQFPNIISHRHIPHDFAPPQKSEFLADMLTNSALSHSITTTHIPPNKALNGRTSTFFSKALKVIICLVKRIYRIVISVRDTIKNKVFGQKIYYDGDSQNFLEKNTFLPYTKQFANKSHELLSKKEFAELNKISNSSPTQLDSFSLKMHKLLKLFDQGLKNTNARNWHRETTLYIRALQNMLASIHNKSELQNQSEVFLREMSYFRYREIKLTNEIQYFLEKTSPNSTKFTENTPITLFIDRMKEVNEELKANPKFGERESLDEPMDANLFGNLPFEIGTLSLKNDKQTHIIRMPSITSDIKTNRNISGHLITKEASIVAEFSLYEQTLQKNNKKHFYFNLMSRQFENENLRSLAIEKLDTRETDAVSTITLDKDSHFWKQIGFYLDRNKAKDFKKSCIYEMFDAETNLFYWSSHLNKTDLRKNAKKFLEEIHHNIFKNNENLSQEERQDFIEILYLYIIDYALNEIQPDGANFSCKQCIDRGATQTAALIIFDKMKKKKSLTKEEQDFINTIHYGPALMVSNRPPQNSRVIRNLRMLKRLAESRITHNV